MHFSSFMASFTTGWFVLNIYMEYHACNAFFWKINENQSWISGLETYDCNKFTDSFRIMYCLFVLTVCFIRNALSLGTLNGTSYPIPVLNVVGNYDAFYDGQCNLMLTKDSDFTRCWIFIYTNSDHILLQVWDWSRDYHNSESSRQNFTIVRNLWCQPID